MLTAGLFARLPFALLLLAMASAQAPAPTAGTTAAPPKVYIIGASVSGGFEDGPLTGAAEQGDSVTLQTVLQAWLQPVGGKVSSFPPIAMQGLFLNPQGTGEKEIKAAIKNKPDLVVGIDFPFWFGYGRVDGSDEKQSRLAKLEAGLALLDQLDGELIVGDFPDMTGAAARMLAPSWVPTPAALAALNERLAAWVLQHQGKPGQPGPRVHLFLLSTQVQVMKRDGVAMQLQGGALRCPPKALLQGDHLHANRLGMAWLGYQLQQFCRREFAAGSVLHQPELSLDDFIAGVKAEGEVEALRAAAKPAASTAGSGK